jgi:hypothetical protein
MPSAIAPIGQTTLLRRVAGWGLLPVILVQGCGAGADRRFALVPYDSTTPVRVIDRFFRDNRPEDVEVKVSTTREVGREGLVFDEGLHNQILKAVQFDTRAGDEKGTMPVGIEALLTVSLHGPHYSLRVRLLRGFGFVVGATLYHVESPSLAEALTEVSQANGLLAGYEGRELTYALALGAGAAAAPPGPPTEAEHQAVNDARERSDYAYEMSAEEWSFLQKTRALAHAKGDLNALDQVSEDGERKTRLQWASDQGWQGATLDLLLRGADPNARSSWDCTALHMAASRGRRTCIGLLLLKGASVSATDSQGWTPLHYAASPLAWGLSIPAVDIVEMLVVGGADIDARDHDGCTPLHLAARSGLADVASRLVQLGAHVSLRDKAGKSPLDYARASRNDGLIRFLKDGARPGRGT